MKKKQINYATTLQLYVLASFTCTVYAGVAAMLKWDKISKGEDCSANKEIFVFIGGAACLFYNAFELKKEIEESQKKPLIPFYII